jgi:hypothetical protein
MTNKNENNNIAKALENAAAAVRRGDYGELQLNDSVDATAAVNMFRVVVHKNSVSRPAPTNKTTTWAVGSWFKPKN